MRFGRRWIWIALLAAVIAVVVAGGVVARRVRPIAVATGTVAQTLCTEVFVAHADAEDAYREILGPEQGSQWLSGHLHWSVDARRQEVRADWFGRFVSRAVFRGPAGCLLWRSALPVPPPPVRPSVMMDASARSARSPLSGATLC